jgi:hypothetical protein
MRFTLKIAGLVEDKDAAPAPPAPADINGRMAEILRDLQESVQSAYKLLHSGSAALFGQYQQIISLLSDDNRTNRRIIERLAREKEEKEAQLKQVAVGNVEDAVELEEKRQQFEMQKEIFGKLSMLLPGLAVASGTGGSAAELEALKSVFGSMTQEQFSQIGQILDDGQRSALAPLVEKIMSATATAAGAPAAPAA